MAAACLFAGIFSITPALAVPPDAKDQVQKLMPGAQVEVLPPGTWTVTEDFVPPSGSSTQPAHDRQLTASYAIRLNDRVLLEESGAGGGRCLWGGREGPTKIHAGVVFASFEQFIKDNAYAPLPKAPTGFAIRQVAAMPDSPARIISNRAGTMLYVLCLNGNIYTIDLPNGEPKKILEGAKYAEGGGNPQFLGIALASDGRMYLVGNLFDFGVKPYMNRITIYRTDAAAREGEPIQPKSWATASIPFAIDVFQHSVSYVAEGPDKFIYVSSGSRTDHGEAGNNPNRSKEGETPISSCIWRLDSKSEHPQIEVFARGLRNAFGFCWDDRGRMFATENGPNADPPEEVNRVEAGKHYGFPFQFADWDHKAYPDQPDPPAGLKIEPPLAKLDPHSSPSGIVYLNDRFPMPYRGKLMVARFGNLLPLEKDVGFDIVLVDPNNGEVKPFMSPIARPTDLHLAATGKIYVCEFQRPIRNVGCDFPGRILEISADKSKADDISPGRPGTH